MQDESNEPKGPVERQVRRHPKCLGYTVQTLDGPDSDCGYGTTISCDECRYCAGNKGRGKDPAAKCNRAE